MVNEQNCVIWIQIVSLHTKKSDDIYKDIAKDVETRFETSNCELERLLRKGKNKIVIGLMIGELGRKL